ncbi:ATP-binding protein [Paenibacillus xylaniclasticus]|uniref:ATP-binding protein n=1 Tax=Paenibacillus xylaniclasticus TaxID=588083 RepID=UPI000FD70CE7|nr:MULTISPECIES: ATP-binding protein [Paenibacillus]GFN30016.1 ATPase AAA [Paenibacillus curdlanolyticus]
MTEIRLSDNGQEQAIGQGADCYGDHWDHLLDELSRLKLLIRIEIERMAIREELQDEITRTYPGLALTREEMLRLLDEGSNSSEMRVIHEQIRLFDMEEKLRELSEAVKRRVQASEEQGVLLPLRRLAQWFGLTDYEYDCLVLAIAPQVDAKYGKLLGYLQDDATSQRPTVALALRLFQPDGMTAERRLRYWLPGSTLRAQQLVELQARPIDAHAQSLAMSVIKLDAGAAQFVMEPERLDARVADIAEWRAPLPAVASALQVQLNTSCLVDPASEPLVNRLAAVFSAASASAVKLSAYLIYGPAGSGKSSLAAAACAKAHVPLLIADLDLLPEHHDARAAALRLVCREAGLRRAALVLKGAERLNEGDKPGPVLLWRMLQEYGDRASLPLILLGSDRFVPTGGGFRMPIVELELPLPSVRERAARWMRHVEQSAVRVDKAIDWLAIAEQYRLTAGAIAEAWQLAESLSRWRASGADQSAGGPMITAEDVRDACRRQKQHRLGDIATRIVPQCKVEQLVLPIDQMRRIRQIISQYEQRHRVLTEWNFHGKLSRGKGTNILFAGPPGTGKTMAAEAIAGELGLDLYRIDLSQVISKYIGETEKNLRRLFYEAENSNAVLLFDEADALFGKRSEVKDSHDRHANTEVAYLLQKMEEYEGLSILATNLQHNMDEAFARRMAYRIEFAMPEEEHRYRLWTSMFPEEAPKGADIDYSFLARNIRLSGGNIKNAALTAAYLAAEDGEAIGMRHLIRAVRQEFDKLGKLCLREDFGPYYDWI